MKCRKSKLKHLFLIKSLNFFNKYRDKSEFEKKGLDPDVVEIRFKHTQARLIDTINRVIEQRREIKFIEARN